MPQLDANEVAVEVIVLENVEITEAGDIDIHETIIEIEEKEPTREVWIRFIVENDNDASTIHLKARPSVTIQHVIDKLYGKLGRARQDGDRLTRESDGSNVFDFVGDSVREYVGTASVHKAIRWSFVGDQGGASR